MKYYVEINGESSLNIQGLAIQSLPPISKPLMRSKQETIDGRDGDVITKLGYAAYDKTLKIGLWGNYDINEIITFFNQEGEIVFSSEPDKYYRFTILNRDDYINQLEIFKTATIILHCQPYKYLLNEEPKEMENEYITETNVSSATFENTLEAPMNIDLKGNTLQNGTPTPSSPIPINNVSGDNDIVAESKNLCNGINQNCWLNNACTSAGQTDGNSGLYIKANGGKYTISTTSTQTRYRVACFDNLPLTNQGQTAYNGTNKDNTSSSITIDTTGHNYLLVNATDLTKIQIEVGETATTYEAYNGTTYNIDLPSGMELNKIGTYQDYIYKENDKWYLHSEVGKYTFNGSETITKLTSPAINTYQCANILQGLYKYIDDYTTNYLSNYFTPIKVADRYVDKTFFINTNGSIVFSYNDITTKELFTTWLGNNNPSIYYQLATPTNTEITYTPLIEQLESIKNAMSKEGTTNVNQVNNDAPFMLDLSVFSGSDTLTINNIGNAPSKPVITLVGSGNVGLYLNDIQVFQISLGDNETIILDTENMEAYYGTELKNRQVIGDYNSFYLQSGDNTIRFTGSVFYIEITNYNRWI